MSENHPHHARVEALLSQDTVVSSFQFEEFRVNLESSIEDLKRRARAMRRASLWGLGIFLTCCVLVIPLEMIGLFEKYQWARIVWSGCGLVAMFTTGVLAGIYQYRFEPALERAKDELQSTMFAQLQQQVAELSHKLDSR